MKFHPSKLGRYLGGHVLSDVDINITRVTRYKHVSHNLNQDTHFNEEHQQKLPQGQSSYLILGKNSRARSLSFVS